MWTAFTIKEKETHPFHFLLYPIFIVLTICSDEHNLGQPFKVKTSKSSKKVMPTPQYSSWITRTIPRRQPGRQGRQTQHKRKSQSLDDFPSSSQAVNFRLDEGKDVNDSSANKQATVPNLSVHDHRRFNALLNQSFESTSPDRRTSKKHQTRAYVLYHDRQFRYFWDIYIFFLLCYVATISVYVYSFKSHLTPSSAFFWIERFLDVSFVIDIILNFFTFYHKHPDQDFHPTFRTTLIHYLTTFFLIDLVSTIPWDVVNTHFRDEATLYMLFRFLRLLRLIKLYRLSQVFRSRHSLVALEVKLRLKYAHVRLITLAVIVCLIAHWFACIFYLFGTVRASVRGELFDSWTEDPTKIPEDLFGRYIIALYFSVYTITTIGYGDVVPGTTIERIYVVIIMLLGAACFAWVISQVSNVYGELRESSAAYRRTMDSLTHLCRVRNVPDNLAIDMRIFLQKYYTYRRVADEKELLDIMSGDLRDRLLSHMYGAYVELLVALFPGTCSSDFDSIYPEISERFARKNDKLYGPGEAADKAFIVKRGAVKITATEHERRAASHTATGISETEVRDSGVVGAVDMAVMRIRTHGAVVTETSELVEIPREAVVGALQSNRKVWRQLRDQHAKKLWRQAEAVIAKRARLAKMSEKLLARVTQMKREEPDDTAVNVNDDIELDKVMASEEICSDQEDRSERFHARRPFPRRSPRQSDPLTANSSSLQHANEMHIELEQKTEHIRFLEQQLVDLRGRLNEIITALQDSRPQT